MAITSVGQEYKSTEGCHDYKTSTGVTSVDGDSQWTLEDPTRTLRMGSRSASTTTSINIWQRNAR